MLPDVLNTAQLRLRPFRLQDVDDVLSYATDPAWARYLPVPQPYTKPTPRNLSPANCCWTARSIRPGPLCMLEP